MCLPLRVCKCVFTCVHCQVGVFALTHLNSLRWTPYILTMSILLCASFKMLIICYVFPRIPDCSGVFMVLKKESFGNAFGSVLVRKSFSLA